MAPKKKQQKQKTSSSVSKGKSSTSAGPKLQISAENENRLRRLLLNSGRSTGSSAPENDSLTKEQKAKKLRSIYEKLSCEGFTDDQIERVLSALKVRKEKVVIKYKFRVVIIRIAEKMFHAGIFFSNMR